MINEEDEYFLRTSILLLKGGRLMSKETLYKKLRKAGGDIDVLLKPHERKFKHKFVKKQREKLFPDAGVTDVETWDLAMLTTVLLTVFKRSLNDDEKNALKSIKCMRDEIYAHTYSSSLSHDQYEEIREEIQNALTSLSNRLSKKLKEDCFQIIQECTAGPIRPSLKAEFAKQIKDTEHAFLAVMGKLRNQGEFLCKMKKDIMDTLKEIGVIEGRSRKIIKVIDTKLMLSGAVNESKDMDFVEGIITTVINKAIKKVGNENDYPRIRSVVDKILKDIDNMPDERCTTYIGAKTIEHIWSLFETGRATNRLKELLEAVFDEINKKITVTPSVNLEQVQAAINDAGEKSAELSQAPVEDNASSPQRHQSKSVDEGEKSAELSQVPVGDNGSSPQTHQSKSVDEGEKSAELSQAPEDFASSPQRHQSKSVDKDSGGLKPRKYQQELAEYAIMGKNTIICSGTGSGKTIVALHIIKKHLEGAPKGKRKVVFMARTGALIKQQAERCKQCLQQYETRLITGDEDRTKSINMFVEHYDILCFTPQILVNSLDDNLIESLSVFSLLVSDEYHNTRGNEPYVMFVRKYLIEKHNEKKQLPQIVGSAASVGVGKSRTIKEAEEKTLRLCACFDVCHLSTVKKNEKGYKKHIKGCTEETIRLEKRTTDPARDILLTAMKETEDMLEEGNDQSLSVEESTEQKNRKQSDMVTSVRTGDFSTKNVGTNVDKTGATVGESTSTNVRTNDYMNSTSSSMTRESSIGYPLKKTQDDTLTESMIYSLSEQMKSVGILIAKQWDVGTVFRVGSKYLMTAHHVVKGLVMDDSVYVTFHESALDLQKKVYHIEKVIFSNQNLDVAVLELASLDSTLPPKMQLSKDDVDILNVKDVSFIGYGHPGKSYVKHLDPRCKLISAQSHRFLEAHTWLGQNIIYIKNAVSKMGQDPEIVNKGYGCYADDHKIIFDCFMQQGASGSPALTYNNYGQVKVAGILTHGLPEFYFLMPELTRHLVDSNHRFEVASKMSSIYSSILNENEDLANDLFE